MRNKLRRPLAFLLSAVMIVTMSGTPVHAVADRGQPETGLCEHHTAHTDDCGYTEETPGTPCGHEHTEDCYTEVTECVHEHTPECYPEETEDSVSDNEATPANAEEREPENCPHICDGESGCITEKLDCRHEHDSECGYTESTPGTPCTYVCEICNPQDSGEADEEPETGIIKQEQCSCLTLCTEGQINPDCPVCGGSDAGLSDCKGKAAEEDTEQPEDTGICKHHQEHDDACGYQPASEDGEGRPCTYDCRICPIEELIAALPDEVTPDNADEVRAQLDHILALYGELNEDEQEKIDLTRCYALQEALDEANVLMPVSTGDVVLSRAQTVTFTEAECGSNCQGHRITQSGTSAVAATAVYVKSGEHNVTFSGLNLTGANIGVMPGGTMHLTIEDSNNITSGANRAGIYVPKTAALTIGGTGSLTVRSTSNAGIGGSIYAPDNSTGDLDCGTVVINSGTVTVFGGSNAAGIGGTCKLSTEPGGNGGDVTINGGEVAVTGGDNQAWGGPAIGSPIGRPAGCSGTLTINGGHVTLTAASQYGKPSGFGSSSRETPSDGPNKMVLASADYLTLGSGTILDSRASYELMGTPLTMDLITVPEGLVYTGKDLTDIAKSKISLGSEGAGTQSLLGVNFTVITDTAGWTYTITPAQVKEAGEYTVIYTKGSDKVTKTFTVAGVTASLGKIETYDGNSNKLEFSVGDTITVKVPVTLEPPLNDTSELKMMVCCEDTPVSLPAAASPDGTYTMAVSTNELVQLLNLDFSKETLAEKMVTLTAKYFGNSSVSSAEASVKVWIYANAMIEKGGDVSYVGRNLADVFTRESGNDGATITLLNGSTLHDAIDIQINCTLNLNSWTVFARDSDYAIYVDSNCQVTIQGLGEVNGTLVVAGDVTLDGEIYFDANENKCAVSVVSGGELSVTGDVKIFGPGYGLKVADGAAVQLSAGIYAGETAAIQIHNGGTLADLLGHDGDTNYAYFNGDTPIALQPDVKELTGTVTVKACNHTGEGVCTYAHIENTSTHTRTCLACGETWKAEECAYTFSGAATGTCAACGGSVAVAVRGTENLVYDGTAKTPGVTVTRGKTELAAGTDYTVAYSDNKNAGENKATVTVTIGNGQGSYTENFSIGRATPTITWSSPTQELAYTGEKAAITAPHVTLVNNEQFSGTINYSYAVGGSDSFTPGLPADAGTYAIKASIEAKGNYTAADSTNTLTLTITTNPGPQSPLSAVITPARPMTVRQSPIQQRAI